MALLECKLSKGLRDAEATVEVKDFNGRSEFLPVDRAMIEKDNGKDYLPVTIVLLDKAQKAAVVSFPVEADSGAHRIWVKLANLKDYSEAPS